MVLEMQESNGESDGFFENCGDIDEVYIGQLRGQGRRQVFEDLSLMTREMHDFTNN